MSAAEKLLEQLLEEARAQRAATEAMRAELQAIRRQSANDGKALISRAAAAKRLGMRREKLAQLIAEGKLPLVLDGGRGKINPKDLERLVESGQLAPRRRGRPRRVRTVVDDTPITWKPTT